MGAVDSQPPEVAKPLRLNRSQNLKRFTIGRTLPLQKAEKVGPPAN